MYKCTHTHSLRRIRPQGSSRALASYSCAMRRDETPGLLHVDTVLNYISDGSHGGRYPTPTRQHPGRRSRCPVILPTTKKYCLMTVGGRAGCGRQPW